MSDAIDERIAKILRQPYHWIIQPGADGYSAWVLEFPGCFSSGETAEEAVVELQDAITGWVSIELESGHGIPEPIDPEHSSGRTQIRIPPSLHYRAQVRAEMEGISLNRLLSDAVSRYMGDAANATASAAEPEWSKRPIASVVAGHGITGSGEGPLPARIPPR
jgi:predicted RNase H-like HicB family nuclease